MKLVLKQKHIDLPKYTNSSLNKTILIGFLVRLFLLIIILFLAEYDIVKPYLFIDDINYEELARRYMSGADHIIDVRVFENIGASGYLTVFWPWVVCITAYIFRTIYAARFINVVLSTLCIGVVYNLTYGISLNKKTALLAAQLVAFMPYSVIACCFAIKDIFLMFGVFYIFNILVRFRNSISIKAREWFFAILLLWAIFNTRGAVLEFMLLVISLYILFYLYERKMYVQLIAFVLTMFIMIFIFSNYVINTFQQKVDDYFYYERVDTAISFLRVDSISQLWKLPLTYFFAMLQPIQIGIGYSADNSLWSNILSYLNISAYPIAIGNMLYFFIKKQNILFWLSSLMMFFSVITLSAAISRHYLFLLPLAYINFSLFKEKAEKSIGTVLMLGSLGMLIMNLFYSMF